MASPTYFLQVDATAIRVLLARTSGPGGMNMDTVNLLGQSIRKWGVMLQTRAVFNVTGHPVVSPEGGYFVVRVRTGALRSSIEMQWPYQTAFQARVFVNGTVMNPGEIPAAGVSRPRPVSQYAAAIEFGHEPIDLKRTMRGKIVPFFGAKAQKARGPYAAQGLKPLDDRDQGYGSSWQSEALNRKLAGQGKGPMIFEKKGGHPAYSGQKQGASTYFISFRRVGDKGWVIPEAKPRPFLGSAVQGVKEPGRKMVARDFARALVPGSRR